MKIQGYVEKYLPEPKFIQLATVGEGGKPWVCTVHFVVDKDSNIYWLSWPTRRHSEEVSKNSNVAITMVVKSDMPVIGLQAEGTAEQITSLPVVSKMMLKYVKKYGIGKGFYERVVSGDNKHRMYKLTPERFSLFDEVNFPKDSPQEWVLY